MNFTIRFLQELRVEKENVERYQLFLRTTNKLPYLVRRMKLMMTTTTSMNPQVVHIYMKMKVLMVNCRSLKQPKKEKCQESPINLQLRKKNLFGSVRRLKKFPTRHLKSLPKSSLTLLSVREDKVTCTFGVYGS